MNTAVRKDCGLINEGKEVLRFVHFFYSPVCQKKLALNLLIIVSLCMRNDLMENFQVIREVQVFRK